MLEQNGVLRKHQAAEDSSRGGTAAKQPDAEDGEGKAFESSPRSPIETCNAAGLSGGPQLRSCNCAPPLVLVAELLLTSLLQYRNQLAAPVFPRCLQRRDRRLTRSHSSGRPSRTMDQ